MCWFCKNISEYKKSEKRVHNVNSSCYSGNTIVWHIWADIYMVGLLIMVCTMIIEKHRVNEIEMSEIAQVEVWVSKNEKWVHNVKSSCHGGSTFVWYIWADIFGGIVNHGENDDYWKNQGEQEWNEWYRLGGGLGARKWNMGSQGASWYRVSGCYI